MRYDLTLCLFAALLTACQSRNNPKKAPSETPEVVSRDGENSGPGTPNGNEPSGSSSEAKVIWKTPIERKLVVFEDSSVSFELGAVLRRAQVNDRPGLDADVSNFKILYENAANTCKKEYFSYPISSFSRQAQLRFKAGTSSVPRTCRIAVMANPMSGFVPTNNVYGIVEFTILPIDRFFLDASIQRDYVFEEGKAQSIEIKVTKAPSLLWKLSIEKVQCSDETSRRFEIEPKEFGSEDVKVIRAQAQGKGQCTLTLLATTEEYPRLYEERFDIKIEFTDVLEKPIVVMKQQLLENGFYHTRYNTRILYIWDNDGLGKDITMRFESDSCGLFWTVYDVTEYFIRPSQIHAAARMIGSCIPPQLKGKQCLLKLIATGKNGDTTFAVNYLVEESAAEEDPADSLLCRGFW